MDKKKKILVLPGSYWQLELVKKIREMGHEALVVNPFDNSACFAHADGFLQADIFDQAKVMQYCEDNHIDAVMSDECDIAMPVVAKIAEEFSLSALDPASARLYTDKFMMREFCRANGLKYPEYRLCRNVEDALRLFHEIKRPLILKPLDCNASKGVFKVTTEEEIRQYFDEAMRFSRVDKCVLAERYIEGTEFTIDGIKTPSAHYTLGISEKKHFAHNINIASELLFSHHNDRFDYDALRTVNNKFVMSSNLKFGFTHAEYKCENGEYYLIEIAARGGGNMISSVITQFLSGHDTYRYLIDCSLGNITEQDFSVSKENWDRAAVLKFFKTPAGGGKVKEIRGLEFLDKEPDVKEYMLNFDIGDVIEDAVSDSARIGFYILCCESMDKLEHLIDNIENTFKIILEE